MHPLDAGGLVAALNRARVDFVIIGGFAVGAHGYPRSTKDLDIVPDPDVDNLRRLADLLVELDAELLGVEEFRPEELIQPDLEGLSGGGSFVMRTRLGRLDIMQLVGPDLEYPGLVRNAVEDQVFGEEVKFCSYEDLIAMKETAGRPEDLLDIQRLREAREDDQSGR